LVGDGEIIIIIYNMFFEKKNLILAPQQMERTIEVVILM
jgi:hypothetical protein